VNEKEKFEAMIRAAEHADGDLPYHCYACHADFAPTDKELDLPYPVCVYCGSKKVHPNPKEK